MGPFVAKKLTCSYADWSPDTTIDSLILWDRRLARIESCRPAFNVPGAAVESKKQEYNQIELNVLYAAHFFASNALKNGRRGINKDA